MLSNETMGAFCLGVVWLNAMLVVAHVVQSARALGVPEGERVKVKVASGQGALAEIRIAQRGRAITTSGPDRILFTESSRTVVVHAVDVEHNNERLHITTSENPTV